VARVLVVDDESEYLDALTRALSRRGFEAFGVPDGIRALDTLRCAEFDAVVLDLKMSVMDGIATLEAIRNLDRITPVLILTGHGDLERLATAVSCGATDFLLKPCPVETLVSAIENAIERKAIMKELEASRRSPPAGSRP
jgi:DNA-binding NtrC family response regulator